MLILPNINEGNVEREESTHFGWPILETNSGLLANREKEFENFYLQNQKAKIKIFH